MKIILLILIALVRRALVGKNTKPIARGWGNRLHLLIIAAPAVGY